MENFIKNAFELNGIKFKEFAAPLNKEKILAEFRLQQILGEKEGFLPLIISVSDLLAESIGFSFEDNNFDADFSGEEYYKNIFVTLERAKEIDGKEVLQIGLPNEEVDPETVGAGLDFIKELGRVREPEIFSADYPPDGVIIVNIPTTNPWELPAWVPMGGFNDCPNPENQVAIFKYWYDTFGAVPICVSYDIWELEVSGAPQTVGDAITLAREQYSFCYDIVEQGVGSLEALAANLYENNYWYFWWD